MPKERIINPLLTTYTISRYSSIDGRRTSLEMFQINTRTQRLEKVYQTGNWNISRASFKLYERFKYDEHGNLIYIKSITNQEFYVGEDVEIHMCYNGNRQLISYRDNGGDEWHRRWQVPFLFRDRVESKRIYIERRKERVLHQWHMGRSFHQSPGIKEK